MKRKISKLFMLLIVVFSTSVLLSSCGAKDADIEKSLNEKIQSTPEMSGLTASVKDGVVTLNGECKDDACKSSCESAVKGMKGVKSVVSNITITPPAAPVEAAPVVIAGDEELMKAVTDATKDFRDVKFAVKDSIVTLTGEIKKTDLPKLLQAVNAARPKKVENQLVIK